MPTTTYLPLDFSSPLGTLPSSARGGPNSRETPLAATLCAPPDPAPKAGPVPPDRPPLPPPPPLSSPPSATPPEPRNRDKAQVTRSATPEAPRHRRPSATPSNPPRRPRAFTYNNDTEAVGYVVPYAETAAGEGRQTKFQENEEACSKGLGVGGRDAQREREE